MMKESIIVKIMNSSNNALPSYATDGSAGLDLRAKLNEPLTIHPKQFEFIPTGVAIQLPEGMEAQVRSRSGLAFKYGICVLNGVGTIDADYRGEIGVILMNHSNEPYTIKKGERVAQLVINEIVKIKLEVAKSLNDTERGNGGYGSTGKL